MRLMTGLGLLGEGFKKEQVGSSAMPHKNNARNSERINGFHQILRGFDTMVAGLTGDQWNEGDVSCSVVRRVAIPGAFLAADCQLEVAHTVLLEMEVYNQKISEEINTYLPFLASSSLMLAGVKKGAGRESMHDLFKEHIRA